MLPNNSEYNTNDCFMPAKKQYVVQSSSGVVCSALNSNRFIHSVSENNYSDPIPPLLQYNAACTNRMLLLSQFGFEDLVAGELSELKGYLYESYRKSGCYKGYRQKYNYNLATPIAYVLYKNITFMMAKANTIVSERYTRRADGTADVLLYTDGELFEHLLLTKNLQFNGSSNYLKIRFLFTENDQLYKTSFPMFVMYKNGMSIPNGNKIHHINDIRDSRSLSMMGVCKDEHLEKHREGKRMGHSFSSDRFMDYLIGDICDTSEEADNIRQNLSRIVDIIPMFKGIIVDDLDLSSNLINIPIAQIISHLTLF